MKLTPCWYKKYFWLGLSCILHGVSAWVLVSKKGEVAFVAPLDINPSYGLDARISFKSAGRRVWDMYVDTKNDNHFKLRGPPLSEAGAAEATDDLQMVDYLTFGRNIGEYCGRTSTKNESCANSNLK